MAVLPTPGSPISTGLFLVRRDSTCTTRRISASRPITGSSLPRRASSVRSRPYFFSASYLSSGASSVTRRLPRTACRAWSTDSTVTPRPPATFATSPVLRPRAARNRCSALTYSSFIWAASLAAASSVACRSREAPRWTPSPSTCGRARSWRSSTSANRSALTPIFSSRDGTTPPSCRTRASARWSASTSAWRRSSARRWASRRASWAFVVKGSVVMAANSFSTV